MNWICKIFGHKKIIRDWYPTDPVSSIACLRCDKVFESQINPSYFFGSNLPKMICMDNKNTNLTEGKVYDILHKRDHELFIKDDSGKLSNFNIRRFTTIANYRKEKLERIKKIKNANRN